MDKESAIRILPVLMIVAAICFGVRFSEMMKDDSSSEISAIEPLAGAPETAAPPLPGKPAVTTGETIDPAAPPPDEALAGKDGEKAPEKPVIEAPALGEAPPVPDASKQGQWKGADDLDDEYSEVKMEMFSDLAKRRKDIESKEKDVAMREALLKAAQTELEQKYTELTTIKTDIEELLKKQTDEENKQIASLVKIYEGMKAKDAARIFDTLDMDVLLQVLT